MTSFARSQWSLLSGATAVMEAARAQALADAAAEAEANNLPLIATVPEGTPDPGVWIEPASDVANIARRMSCPPSCPDEPMADKLRRLASPLALVVLAGVALVAISMTDKPGEF